MYCVLLHAWARFGLVWRLYHLHGCMPAGKQDCQGSWGPWSVCAPVDAVKQCGPCTQSRAYSITSAAVNGGQPCEAADAAVETTDCSYSPCNCTGNPTQAHWVESWNCGANTTHAATCHGGCISDGTAVAICNDGVFDVVTTCTPGKRGLLSCFGLLVSSVSAGTYMATDQSQGTAKLGMSCCPLLVLCPSFA